MSKIEQQQAVHIDGAHGEGGGQIIRTSVSLAAITGRTVEIVNIRARRSKPGLQAQHLTSVLAAGALCEAKLYGAELGSQYLRFVPGGQSQAETFRFDVAEARGGASAGATGLVAQTILAPLAFLPAFRNAAPKADAEKADTEPQAGVRVTLLGGTHVPMAPPSDYVEAVYIPMLQKMGLEASLESVKAGFFPKGGGEIVLSLLSGGLQKPLDLTERGRLQRLCAYITTSQLPEHVATRAEDLLRKELKGFGIPIHTVKRDLSGNGPGAAILLVAECQIGRGGWVILGERGKPIEKVAADAIDGFREWQATNASVDEHLADQLALPCALIDGVSRWTTPRVTEHLRTVLWVTQQFLPIVYAIQEREDGSGLITLRGVKL